jgi:GDPmannose 4,6-dehydratase
MKVAMVIFSIKNEAYMKRKKALITGITGQDGSYLADFLIEKGYEVHGILRRSSTSSLERIKHIIDNPQIQKSLILHQGDLIDASSIKRIVDKVNPDEIYNLGAMTHVKISFDTPEAAAEINSLGTVRLLEAMRHICPNAKFYQASTSELFGKAQEMPQKETTPFYPRSPYAVSKLMAYWSVVNYREAYNLFACNGILFNHESPRRGENFVTRKIILAIVRIKHGLQKELILGNLSSQRDWGYAKDFVEGMWLMLQQKKAEDFVLATEKTSTVREFASLGFKAVDIDITWEGKDEDEVGIDFQTGKVLVRVSKEFFRPTEVDILCGDATKAKKILGWKSKTSLEDLATIMIESDMKNIPRSLAPLNY